eukprot:CAMPEP_0119410374 /NCGR_PEP_ID=MMETSP1335-20130426/3413_1 /TAXON_ID=259385 /ORGANISM="Chrysoculter rhomboideus, Strain RCC1486" /LENGTH=30 /DNA_ID= /DNA_START= /DNA_END= /DNA_ORIENTATION=
MGSSPSNAQTNVEPHAARRERRTYDASPRD